ncbi:MAG TPA: crosslink repair DNA glycosylase YcaQ family protein, partial [Actinomycetota bacterium]|nr:crosslink repair DNA glycosylase YcaQ family protein [Actinomycetota bacterium]
GWRDRSFAVGDWHAARVHPGGGVLRPVAIVRGVVVGTWTYRRSKDHLAVHIDAFTAIDARSTAELRNDARDVARFESPAPSA